VEARTLLLSALLLSYCDNRENKWCTISASVCSACLLNSSLSLTSKQMRKQDFGGRWGWEC
jgi:hypothetical protein